MGLSGGIANIALNLALVVGAVLLGVLLYSLVDRSFSSGAIAERPPIAVATTADTLASGQPAPPIQVDVRNGCGQAGLARDVTLYLQDRGFDVVEAGNWRERGIDSSFVVDRRDEIAVARRVAAAMGLSDQDIVNEPNPALFLDATVVIGCDYLQLRPFH
ncbi:LytR C-terminal domain-containing protein [soil metagenome]